MFILALLAGCEPHQDIDPEDIDTDALMHGEDGAYLGYGNAEGQSSLCHYSCLLAYGFDSCGYLWWNDQWQAPFAGCLRDCGFALTDAPGWIEPWSSCVLDQEPGVLLEATRWDACFAIDRGCLPKSPCPNGPSAGYCGSTWYPDLRDSSCGWTCTDGR